MNRTILLCGCSGGIGWASVLRLTAEGVRVRGIDIVPPPDPDVLEGFAQVDLTNVEATMAALQSETLPTEGLWGLVYCVGVYPGGHGSHYDVQEWQATQAVNVLGAQLVVSAVADRLCEGGRIVLVSSAAAHGGSRDPAYAASKAALLGLAKSYALTLAHRGILVNAVAPGIIDTKMNGSVPESRSAEHVQRTLLDRKGRPEEVAEAIAFLLTPANSYMTGATLDVNGGLLLR